MDVLEFQAKDILRTYNLPVLPGKATNNPDDAASIYRELAASSCVVKAQICGGGRGKAGGIRPVHSPEEATDIAKQLLGTRLVTSQTGHKGSIVPSVLIETAMSPVKEMYAAVTLDRSVAKPTFIFCEDGGIDIEEIAAKSPEKIHREILCPRRGMLPFQAHRILAESTLDPVSLKEAVSIFIELSRAFINEECLLLEINPLATDPSGKLYLLDAKMTFDDNALYRHPRLEMIRESAEEEPKEAQAHRHNLSYVQMDGNIGCMVNGAGLAMATMDIIKHHGGQPANFLDVGGGASKEQVTVAFELLLSDEKVQAILVNIFGGIMRCDVIAQGILDAVGQVGLNRPLVVRLEGTNVDEGRRILAASDLKLIPASDMSDAARKVVAAAKSS